MNLLQQRKQLVETLEKHNRIKTDKIKKAFLQTPREKFIPEKIKKYAYIDTPLEIGNNQTISAPHMIAIMCEILDIKPGQKILEIGAGSGYHAAIVAKITGETGHVYTIERHETLAKTAKDNLKNAGITNVTVETGDGSIGLEKHAPYDRIYVTCASPSIPPPFIEQLKDPGILLIPIGDKYCILKSIEKKQEKIITHEHTSCVFVPLIGKYGF